MTHMKLQEMTGLQLLQAMGDGTLPHPAICDTMPMRLIEAEAGRVLFEVTANKTHTNPLGIVHGGFASTIIDSVTGCASHTLLEAGVGYGTVDLNVKMVRPIPFDTPLKAEGRVINAGKRVIIAEGNIKDDEGKIYAHGTCTCLVTR